jgi:hypothetical protein
MNEPSGSSTAWGSTQTKLGWCWNFKLGELEFQCVCFDQQKHNSRCFFLIDTQTGQQGDRTHSLGAQAPLWNTGPAYIHHGHDDAPAASEGRGTNARSHRFYDYAQPDDARHARTTIYGILVRFVRMIYNICCDSPIPFLSHLKHTNVFFLQGGDSTIQRPTHLMTSHIIKRALPVFSREAQSLQIGGIYAHYKGMRYTLLATAHHSETLEELVVYQALDGEPHVWVRPLTLFCGQVITEGRLRFSLLLKP